MGSNSEFIGIINPILNCDTIYSIHMQHLVKVEHTHTLNKAGLLGVYNPQWIVFI